MAIRLGRDCLGRAGFLLLTFLYFIEPKRKMCYSFIIIIRTSFVCLLTSFSSRERARRTKTRLGL